MKRKRWVVAGGAALAVIGAGAWFLLRTPDPITTLQSRTRDLPMALADSSLMPPTNKWFSSLAFKQPSDPVFAYPLALKTTANGFALSHPTVTATPNTVHGAFVRDIGLNFGDDVKSFIRSYDDLSVLLEVRAGNDMRATYRITQGSPYIFMQLKKDARFTVENATIHGQGNTYQLASNGREYGLFVGSGAHIDSASGTIQATDDNAHIALYIVPQNADRAALQQSAQHSITGTTVRHALHNASAETTFVITTQSGQPTILGLLPSQLREQKSMGTATTLLGVQTFVQGNDFSFTIPLPDMPSELPIANITPDERTQLSNMVRHDIEQLTFTATDTYFAGKELYRAANLLQLARQLGLTSEAAAALTALKTELSQWFDANTGDQRGDKFFYYDATIKGVVGQKPSFGSEDFNDHHFHYGYFLYAAAIVGRYDPVFVSQYGAYVTLLARDIANPRRDDPYLPYSRNFDHYAGHAWASGFAPFGDGNNQESSSEAAHAWYATALWAEVSHNSALKSQAQWQFAREAHAALTYYINVDVTRPGFNGYAHSVVSLLWGGKADYATFFDAAPESKLAIQLLPMHPAAAYVGADKQRIMQNLAALQRETGAAPSKFKDYLLMYKALADPQGALADAKTLGDADIDGANSRSYLYAWLFTR